MTLLALLLPGCSLGPCPEGFVRDNAGNCLQMVDDDEGADDEDADADDDSDDGEGGADDSDEPERDSGEDEPERDSGGDDEPDRDSGGDADPCTSHATTTCNDGDVWYEDACGELETRKETCAYACADDGSEATCVGFEIECEEAEHECRNSGDVNVDFECRVRNLGDEVITLAALELTPTSTDASRSDFLDDYWAGPGSFNVNTWVTLDDYFSVNVSDDYSDEDLDLTVEADLQIWGVTVLISGITTHVDVSDSWVSTCQSQAD